jgi:hypothetical protein
VDTKFDPDPPPNKRKIHQFVSTEYHGRHIRPVFFKIRVLLFINDISIEITVMLQTLTETWVNTPKQSCLCVAMVQQHNNVQPNWHRPVKKCYLAVWISCIKNLSWRGKMDIDYNYINGTHNKSFFFNMHAIYIITQLTHVTSAHKPTSSTSSVISYCLVHTF